MPAVVTHASNHSSQSVVDGRINKVGVSTAARGRSSVLAVEWTRVKVVIRNVVAPARVSKSPQECHACCQLLQINYSGVGDACATCPPLFQGI